MAQYNSDAFSLEDLEDINLDDLLDLDKNKTLDQLLLKEEKKDLLKNIEDFDEDVMVDTSVTLSQPDLDEETESDLDENPEDVSFLDNSEVRLKDLISKFFEFSTRPIVIICDDKIQYANPVICDLLHLRREDMLEQNFLNYVEQQDWNLLAENIGIMLTEGKILPIHLQVDQEKIIEIKIEALYIPDDNHFAFALIGNKITPKEIVKVVQTAEGLFDDVTGLPNFCLFEDRVLMAINRESYKTANEEKKLIATAALNISNIFQLQQLGLEDFALKKMASKLAFSLKKYYTIARGIKNQFWILLEGLDSVNELDYEIKKIQHIFEMGIDDNFTTHDLDLEIGVSVYPVISQSARQLLEHTSLALEQAHKRQETLVFYEKTDKQ